MQLFSVMHGPQPTRLDLDKLDLLSSSMERQDLVNERLSDQENEMLISLYLDQILDPKI